MDPTVEIPTRLLVFGMLDEHGSVASADLAPVTAACGGGAEQLRSCLRRLVAEGVFERAGAIGTPEQIRALLRGYEEIGVDQMIFVMQAGHNRHEHICEAMELCSRAR